MGTTWLTVNNVETIRGTMVFIKTNWDTFTMKNNIYLKAIFALSSAVISGVCTAQFDDTSIYRKCIKQLTFKSISDFEKPDSFEQGYCLGFMQSLKGSNEILKISVPSKAFCAPESLGEFDLLKVIIKHAEMDKELKAFPDRYELSRRALQREYPCTVK